MEFNFSDRVKNLGGNAIREIFALLADKEMISFAGGFPTLETLPKVEIEKIVSKLMQGKDACEILQYGGTEGYLPFRKTVIDYVKRYGITNVAVENTLIISGGQQAIDLTMKCFINKGDVVLVENPTYLAVLHIAKTYEANVIGVNADCDGLDMNDLKAKIAKHKPKLLYLVPTFSNPTGRTLSVEKRKEIARITAEQNVMVLEDDPYSLLRFDGESVASLKSFDTTGNVIFATSFSKTIAPGLRCGVLIGDAGVVRKLTIGKQATDVHTSSLSQAIINEYICSGLYEGHITEIVKVYKQKMLAMQAAIKKHMPRCIKFTSPQGGLFIWGEFDKSKNVDTASIFKDVCTKTKVAYVSGHSFYADEATKNAFRLNYSNASFEQIDSGIKKLGDYFKELTGENV